MPADCQSVLLCRAAVKFHPVGLRAARQNYRPVFFFSFAFRAERMFFGACPPAPPMGFFEFSFVSSRCALDATLPPPGRGRSRNSFIKSRKNTIKVFVFCKKIVFFPEGDVFFRLLSAGMRKRAEDGKKGGKRAKKRRKKKDKRTKKGDPAILLQIYYNKFSIFLVKHLEFSHKCVTIILHGIYKFEIAVNYRCIRRDGPVQNKRTMKKQ